MRYSDLAQHLIRIPSITASPNERIDEVHRAGTFIYDYLRGHGFEPRYFDGKYPAVYATFPHPSAGAERQRRRSASVSDNLTHRSLRRCRTRTRRLPIHPAYRRRLPLGSRLSGYEDGRCDVSRLDEGYAVRAQASPCPNISLLLVGNEENGEAEAWGTPHVLKELNLTPSLFIAGERTGEKGNELFGEICVENRGVMRFDVIARGAKGHSGVAGAGDLSEKLINARSALNELFAKHLTLKSPDGWQSQAKFPFINVGTPGIYNVTAAEGILGVEIRPIPQDDTSMLKDEVLKYCEANGLEASFTIMENGVACDPNNPALINVDRSSENRRAEWRRSAEPRIGRKLPGTSARFAPGGQAVVWGQSGLGPHAKDERHYIPCIEPYYKSLIQLVNYGYKVSDALCHKRHFCP